VESIDKWALVVLKLVRVFVVHNSTVVVQLLADSIGHLLVIVVVVVVAVLYYN
jgi:hypothetical protein